MTGPARQAPPGARPSRERSRTARPSSRVGRTALANSDAALEDAERDGRRPAARRAHEIRLQADSSTSLLWHGGPTALLPMMPWANVAARRREEAFRGQPGGALRHPFGGPGAAVVLYGGVFGWLVHPDPQAGSRSQARSRRWGSAAASAAPTARASGVTLYIEVPDIDAALREIELHGARSSLLARRHRSSRSRRSRPAGQHPRPDRIGGRVRTGQTPAQLACGDRREGAPELFAGAVARSYERSASTCAIPRDAPSAACRANSSGVTQRSTGRWRGVGWRY